MACDDKGGVGLKGAIPWPHNPRDLNWFFKHTHGQVMVMGSGTWKDSQLGHPMPDRHSYVVTSKPELCNDAAGCINGHLKEGIHSIQSQHPDKQIWIIGGPGLIGQTLDMIDQFYLSRIPGTFKSDRFLPLEELNRWTVLSREEHPEVTFFVLQNPKHTK